MALLEKIGAFIRLMRPIAIAIALITLLVGAKLTGISKVVVIANLAVTIIFLFGATMAFNDWHDVEEDKINKPGRVLPSNIISRSNALIFSVSMFVLGVLFTILAVPQFGLLSLGFSIASILYTLKLKRVLVLGNLMTAILMTYPVWCWTIVYKNLDKYYAVLIIMAFTGILGREIVKTAEDTVGDRTVGAHTIAVVLGASLSLKLGSTIMFLGLLLGCIPILFERASYVYYALYFPSLLLGTLIMYLSFAPKFNSPSGPISKLALFVMLLVLIAYGWGLYPSY